MANNFLAIRECILYEKGVDTHNIASVTAPIDGKYKIKIKDKWVEKELKAGDVVGVVRRLVGFYCPGYGQIEIEK